MATCIIIDDEKYTRVTLQQLIRTLPRSRLEVLETACSIPEGVAAINKHKPDIVFLDIEMPGQNGFAIFDHFDEISFLVVFCTAYERYAIDAIKFAAFDYLIKPVRHDDLIALMDRYEKLRSLPESKKVKATTLNTNLQPENNTFNSIALPTRDGYQMEKISNIIYCRARESYCQVHFRGKFSYLVSQSLKQIEEILPSDLFFRIHKSLLVNLNFVHTYKKAEGIIILQNGEELEVAHRRSEEFLKRLTRR
jgi:two-component system, LytTR family, response regulator